jgi:pimeloyl-ACP methyl ester carboxylesterase
MLQNSRSLAAELPTPERDPFTTQDAKRISAPALLLKGQDSPQTFQTIISILARSMPNATVSTIENSSHVPYSTNPTAYNKVVLGFLHDH